VTVKDHLVHTPACARGDGHRVHPVVLPRCQKYAYLQGRSSPVWALPKNPRIGHLFRVRFARAGFERIRVRLESVRCVSLGGFFTRWCSLGAHALYRGFCPARKHGGEPQSIDFCHRLELSYVSCSPFRVPVARLAAAQAALTEAGSARYVTAGG